MAGLGSFPEELLEAVVTILKEDRDIAALSSLGRASQTLHRIVRPHLYAHVSIALSESPMDGIRASDIALWRTLRKRPEYGNDVQSITSTVGKHPRHHVAAEGLLNGILSYSERHTLNENYVGNYNSFVASIITLCPHISTLNLATHGWTRSWLNDLFRRLRNRELLNLRVLDLTAAAGLRIPIDSEIPTNELCSIPTLEALGLRHADLGGHRSQWPDASPIKYLLLDHAGSRNPDQLMWQLATVCQQLEVLTVILGADDWQSWNNPYLERLFCIAEPFIMSANSLSLIEYHLYSADTENKPGHIFRVHGGYPLITDARPWPAVDEDQYARVSFGTPAIDRSFVRKLLAIGAKMQEIQDMDGFGRLEPAFDAGLQLLKEAFNACEGPMVIDILVEYDLSLVIITALRDLFYDLEGATQFEYRPKPPSCVT
ncbi:hypothetical protein P154DRAFT_579664 [Amniculicola lignicola CBS 123094]|uniref:Uncharacterized protein n=1 Tax=Amniculicola lignicola CBS 123094 TaxID=1392246 RepID=A0A6A5W7J4_9PLEO|nr:hypothetical protein P154DRAFT_579664 [Amniculicola lignicola CBS 123094]